MARSFDWTSHNPPTKMNDYPVSALEGVLTVLLIKHVEISGKLDQGNSSAN